MFVAFAICRLVERKGCRSASSLPQRRAGPQNFGCSSTVEGSIAAIHHTARVPEAQVYLQVGNGPLDSCKRVESSVGDGRPSGMLFHPNAIQSVALSFDVPTFRGGTTANNREITIAATHKTKTRTSAAARRSPPTHIQVPPSVRCTEQSDRSRQSPLESENPARQGW